jgi:hypothetical protein
MSPPSGVSRLTHGLASGIDQRRTLVGGTDADLVERIRFRNGTWAVHKVVKDPSHVDAEFLVSLVGLSIGAPVPGILQTDTRELYMELMPGRPAVLVLPDEDDETAAPYVQTHGGLLLAMLDSVVANDDRHSGNWLIADDGSISGIDHTEVDTDAGVPDSDGLILPGGGSVSSPFASYWLVQGSSYSEAWKDNVLHPDDVQPWIESVMPLAAEFSGRGYGHWWRAILGRIEAIEAHAKGSKPWLTKHAQRMTAQRGPIRSSHSPTTKVRSMPPSPWRGTAR